MCEINERILKNILENLIEYADRDNINSISKNSISIKGFSVGVFSYLADKNESFSLIDLDFLNIIGYSREEFCSVTGNKFLNMVYDGDRKRVFEELVTESVNKGDYGKIKVCQYRVAAKDGKVKWLLHEQIAAKNSEGKKTVYCAVLDITKEKQEKAAEDIMLSCVKKLNSNDNFDGIMNQVLLGILKFYDGARSYVFEFDWNTGNASNTYRVCADNVSSDIENLKDVPLITFDTLIRSFERGESVFVIDDIEALSNTSIRQIEYVMLKNQNVKSLIAVPIRYNGILHGFIGVDMPKQNKENSEFLINLIYFIWNEMDKRKLNDELNKLSFTDFLTQFYNRNAYNEFLRKASESPEKKTGVIFADLNSLKYMNDNFGHEYGDKMLKYMADTIREYFSNDKVFRISGDEFVIVCRDCTQSAFGEKVARFQYALKEKNNELASIGYVWKREASDLNEMLSKAEQDMYKSKREYYRKKTNTDAIRTGLFKTFANDIKENKFIFYLQPQINIKSGELTGAEALARRIDDNGEIIYPYDFIIPLQRAGCIADLDFYIMEAVCRQLKEWKASGIKTVPIAVNFSMQTIADEKFKSHYIAICKKYGISLSELIIELSCNDIEFDKMKLNDIIYDFQNNNIKFRLKNLTLENDFLFILSLDGIKKVKFDGSLSHKLEDNYRVQLVVKSIIDFCHRMGQECTASGVESENQLKVLSEMGCDVVQGFQLEKPMSVGDFEKKYCRCNKQILNICEEEYYLPEKITELDSLIFEQFSRTADKMYLYIANLKHDFSRWSPSAVKYFGLPGEYITNTAKIWSEYIHPDDRHIFLEDMERIFKGESAEHCCEYRARNAEGEYVWVQCKGNVTRNDDGSPGLFAGTMMNLGNYSKFDPITGLYSFNEYEKQLQTVLENGEKGAMLLFGIDHFKRVNDIHGYHIGDYILEYIGKQMQTIPGGVFYRMDGDKFACIIRNGTAQDVEFIYKQVRYIFKNVTAVKNMNIQLTMSCGSVFFPDQGEQFEMLRANAEYALEQAKKTSRGSLAFYSEVLHKRSLNSFYLQEILHKSIENGFEGFTLNFQPLIDTKSGKVFGAEALLRFSSPDLPRVTPDEFIPVLEETGDINEVGAWVLRTALGCVKKWRKLCPEFHISVNVSYVQMHREEFRSIVFKELERSGVDAGALIIELTESCKVMDTEQLSSDFEFFMSNDVQMALDDFGTGYSSIALLRELKPSWIKIDHSFVASITESHIDKAIIEYILELCRHADIKVCIEGVENENILDIVKEYEPELLQGYYFSKPISESEFEERYIKYNKFDIKINI